jgi:hypothetical protein
MLAGGRTAVISHGFEEVQLCCSVVEGCCSSCCELSCSSEKLRACSLATEAVEASGLCVG